MSSHDIRKYQECTNILSLTATWHIQTWLLFCLFCVLVGVCVRGGGHLFCHITAFRPPTSVSSAWVHQKASISQATVCFITWFTYIKLINQSNSFFIVRKTIVPLILLLWITQTTIVVIRPDLKYYVLPLQRLMPIKVGSVGRKHILFCIFISTF